MLPVSDENAATLKPVVTVAIIVVCVALYLWQHLWLTHAGARAVELAAGLVPAVLTGRASPPDAALLPPLATLVTSMFLHLGAIHLAGNVLFLWVFGNNVEDAMGHARFSVFYLMCGVLAAAVHVLANPDSPVPASGASGAVSGVLGAYLLLYPRARVLLALPLGFINIHFGRWPALWVLASWVLLQIVVGGIAAARAADTGVLLGAAGAHVGGFVAGLLLVTVFKRSDVPLWRRY
jgi:membrane associated rhomboid family serine protease